MKRLPRLAPLEQHPPWPLSGERLACTTVPEPGIAMPHEWLSFTSTLFTNHDGPVTMAAPPFAAFPYLVPCRSATVPPSITEPTIACGTKLYSTRCPDGSCPRAM